jgi:outer membrane protein assembly factor BamB
VGESLFERPFPRIRIMTRFRTSIAAVAFLALASARAADWPTYRGDYARSGVSTQSLAGIPVVSWTWRSKHPPQPAWQGEAKWDGWNKVFDMKPRQAFDRAFHVVASGRRAYFGSSADDQVRCLDARSGQVLWSFFTEGPVRLAPTLHEGRLYFGSDDGCVYCLQAEDGRLIWKTRAVPTDRRIPGNGRIISAWPVRTSAVVQDGKVYVTAGMFPADGVHLIALDAGTGAEVWRQVQNDLPAQGYLLASRSRLYVPAGRNNPAVCDIATGKRVRVVEGAGGTYALLTDDLLVFGPGKTGQLGAVEEGSSDQLASFQGNHMIVTGNRSYLHSDSEISALDRGRYLQLARERKSISAQQAALAKKVKALGNKPGVDEERAQLKKQLADLGKRLDEATQAMDQCLLWKVPSTWPHEVILAGDTLILGGSGEVVGLPAASGKLGWKLPVPGIAYGLAAADDAVFVSTDHGAILCLRSPSATQPTSPTRTSDSFRP